MVEQAQVFGEMRARMEEHDVHIASDDERDDSVCQVCGDATAPLVITAHTFADDAFDDPPMCVRCFASMTFVHGFDEGATITQHAARIRAMLEGIARDEGEHDDERERIASPPRDEGEGAYGYNAYL